MRKVVPASIWIILGMWLLCGSFLVFANFYQLDLHNKTCVALSKIVMKHLQKSDLPLFSYGNQNCMLISSLITLILPIVFTIECRIVIHI